jgi:hypothetical protein
MTLTALPAFTDNRMHDHGQEDRVAVPDDSAPVPARSRGAATCTRGDSSDRSSPRSRRAAE